MEWDGIGSHCLIDDDHGKELFHFTADVHHGLTAPFLSHNVVSVMPSYPSTNGTELPISPDICYYSYADLTVLSEIPLKVLEPLEPFRGISAASPIRLRILRQPVACERRLLFSWEGKYRLSLWAEGDGWMFGSSLGTEFHLESNGREISCHPGPGGWNADVENIFVRLVLPRIAHQRGRLIAHAATIDTGSGAVLIFGPTGTGKSTLAAGLNRILGWTVLSDDTSILSINNEIRVFPAERGFCLRQDSTQALGHSEQRQRLAAAGMKYLCEPESEGPRGPRLVRAIYFLGGKRMGEAAPSSVSATLVRPMEAVALMCRQFVRFNPADTAKEHREFEGQVRLAASVPCSMLIYPRQFEALPKVAGLLAGQLRP